MAFNPDDYLNKKLTSFNPDAYLSSKNIPINDISELESGVRGLAQGALFGFADEATAGLESLFTNKSYEQSRDESRRAYEQAQQANPITYGAGQLGGAVATAFIPGLGEMNIAKAAAMGGTQALGESNAKNFQDMAIDTAQGVALGGVTQGVIDKAIVPGLKYLGKGLSKVDDFVTSKGLKIGGNIEEDATAAYLKNPNAINNASGYGDLAENFLKKEDGVLSKYDDIIRKEDTKAWDTLSDTNSPINKQDLLNMIDDYFDSSSGRALFVDGVTFGDANKKAVDTIMKRRSEINSFANDMMSEVDLKKTIQALDKDIDWNKVENTPANQALQSFRDYIDGILKTNNPAYKAQMSKVADMTNTSKQAQKIFMNRQNPESYNKFINQANKIAQNPDSQEAKIIKSISEATGENVDGQMFNAWTKRQFEKADANGSRKTLGGSVVGGAIGSIFGGPVGGLVAGAAGAITGQTLDRYSGPLFKKLLDGKILANDFFNQFGNRLGKYGPVLKNAADRGAQSLTVTHFILNQRDSNYRQMIKDLENEE